VDGAVTQFEKLKAPTANITDCEKSKASKDLEVVLVDQSPVGTTPANPATYMSVRRHSPAVCQR
jgi:hypothetical protein